MNFSEGGYWVYSMSDPTSNMEFWARMDYLKIQPIEFYTALDGFCDAEGELNPQLPRANWTVSFQELGDNAIVQTLVTYSSLTDLETVIQMGMQEGLLSTLEKLDEFLLTFKNI
jgi:uncharacterized protein YndB with AHSA1/START domain